MTAWFVSKHESTHDWMRQLMASGQITECIDPAHMVTALDPSMVESGDWVMGTLPMSLILQVLARGGRFRALVLNELPPQPETAEGGNVLAKLRRLWHANSLAATFTADELIEHGARFVDISISESQTQSIPPQPGMVPAIEASRNPSAQVQLAFVSEQLAPIFLPIRQFSRGLEKVVLLASTRMRRQAERLHALLARPIDGGEPLSVEIRDVGETGTYDDHLKAARHAVESIVAAHPGAYLLANLTGGTKPMALALDEALREAAAGGVRVQTLYTNTDINQYEMLAPSKPPVPMRARLNIDTAFGLQGYKVQSRLSAQAAWRTRAQDRAKLSRLLVLVRAHDRVFHQINSLADVARSMYAEESPRGTLKSDVAATVTIADRKGKQEKLALRPDVIDQLKRANVLSVDQGQGKVTFENYESARYLGGTWLEEWVWNELSGLGLDDLACGVEIREGDSGTPNELDVVAAHNNRLLLIECKAALQTREGKNQTSDTLYKIESISDHLSRLHGARLLVTVRSVTNAALARASAARIGVLAPEVRSPQDATKAYGCLVPGMLREVVEQWARIGVLRSAHGLASPFVTDDTGKAKGSTGHGVAEQVPSRGSGAKSQSGNSVMAEKLAEAIQRDARKLDKN